MNESGKPVTVVIGATSKWQSDGRNTHLMHGGDVDDSAMPIGMRWGVGGAISQKFAAEGHSLVLTTRNTANAEPLGRFGAKFLVRAGQQEAREGAPLPRTVVLEFPSYADALACYDDPAYVDAKAIREDAADGSLIIVEGYDG